MNPQIVFDFFPEITNIQKIQFEKLGSVYSDWNSKINLVSRKDIGLLYENHVLHSLAIAKFINFSSNTILLDIGTGGGFPAVPLAIYFPHVKIYALDSIAKKIMAVNDISKQLGLKNLEPVCQRAEQFSSKVDFIVSRATAPFPDLVKWSKNKILVTQNNSIANGIICLKGGNLKNEVASFGKRVITEPVINYINVPYFESKSIVYMAL